ncbi:MAG: AEC family transporter [Chloroflexi bacterium]|nr:AEC family transporter [Chloroflexota bacterium]
MVLTSELATIFFDVITPVFALVVLGYVAGPRLGLAPRTLTRYAYYILIPALILDVIGSAQVDVTSAIRMIAFAVVTHIALAGVGWAVARALGRSEKMVSAYILIAVFGNVGNFGLPLIEFRLGQEALAAATVYFLAIMTIAFIIGVAAASLPSGGGLKATWSVFKTPALIALVPALLLNVTHVQPPLFLERGIDLLAAATVPTMLVALGVQLSTLKSFRFTSDVMIASGIRLIAGPILAVTLAVPFGLTGLERGAGILQAAMPAAILSAIIAMENELIPEFVTTTVLFSTLASVVSLTLVMAFV